MNRPVFLVVFAIVFLKLREKVFLRLIFATGHFFLEPIKNDKDFH